MPTIKPIGIEIFNEYSSAINKCRKEVAAQGWFGGDWWIYSTFSGSAFVFQLAKTSWHNHNGRGIHFEFWIGADEFESRSIPIVLHFEPETPDRAALGKRFQAAFAEQEAAFADYRINHKAICDKMIRPVKLTKSGLHKVVVAEFGRLQTLAPIIDQILLDLHS